MIEETKSAHIEKIRAANPLRHPQGVRDLSSQLVEAFQNPTKLSILLLLLENGRMTVTQMAKVAGVSRPNLYHFVSELVADGLLPEPESIVKGNYVEKYYHIDERTLRQVDRGEQQKKIGSSKPEEIRETLKSFFLTMSLFFRLYAERLSRMNDSSSLENLANETKRHKLTLSYGLMETEEFEFFLAEFQKALRRSEKKFSKKEKGEGKESATTNGNRMVLVMLPESIFGKNVLP